MSGQDVEKGEQSLREDVEKDLEEVEEKVKEVEDKLKDGEADSMQESGEVL